MGDLITISGDFFLRRTSTVFHDPLVVIAGYYREELFTIGDVLLVDKLYESFWVLFGVEWIAYCSR
jgi:hypothetical protein